MRDPVAHHPQAFDHARLGQILDPREARVDWGTMRERQREAAARGVRAVILLDAIAEEEKISLEPEALLKALSDEAARRKQTVEALKGRLANFKVPKRVHVVEELPRNAMGKVQKNILRERFKA